MVKKNVLMFVVASVLSLGALPALADSVHLSINAGDHAGWHRGNSHHDVYRREHVRHWNPPVFFYKPRPVVYVQEPTVIVQQPIQANPGRIISNNPYCREYQRNITVGNHVEQSYGTACRQPDGAWKIVSED